jgi:O-antigen/teichoic acid export membrane protein
LNEGAENPVLIATSLPASPLAPARVGPAGRPGVAHNAVLNFLGLALPLGLAFFVMPIAARYLGAARFGLLGLAWAVTEYLTLFDLGLGRALVKFIADALDRDRQTLSQIVSVSVAAQVATGIIGGIAFYLSAPLLVHSVFQVGPDLAAEATSVFEIVGLSVPVVLLTSAQRGILEGAQRFDLSATVKMLSSAVSLCIPAVGALYGASLPPIMVGILISRLVICAAYAVAIRRALPGLSLVRRGDWAVARRIFSFGAWVLVSNTISPLLVYFDRFALGSIAGLFAVGLYTAPYEGVTRTLVIPASLIGTLLPALTSIEARSERDRFARLTASAERTLSVVMAIPVGIVMVYAPELLRLWLGVQYAGAAATAFRVLAVGVFANALAQPLFVALYAKDRPDLPAKFHLLELAIHIPLTLVLIRAVGITGAAVAWTTRVLLDLSLLSWAAARSSGAGVLEVTGGRAGPAVASIAFFIAGLWGTKFVLADPWLALTGALVTLAGFIALSWRWVLADGERAAIRGVLRTYIKPMRQMPAM